MAEKNSRQECCDPNPHYVHLRCVFRALEDYDCRAIKAYSLKGITIPIRGNPISRAGAGPSLNRHDFLLEDLHFRRLARGLTDAGDVV